MNLVRREPFDFFANWPPPVDIQETEKEYVVKADLPDVKREDVKVDKHFHRTERTKPKALEVKVV
jgi:HSP20 family molecular chaperone IbpA